MTRQPATLTLLARYLSGMKVFRFFFLISDFFTLTILKIIFEISSQERVSYDIMIDPNYQKKVFVLLQNFS